jgi:hypothetical protein
VVASSGMEAVLGWSKWMKENVGWVIGAIAIALMLQIRWHLPRSGLRFEFLSAMGVMHPQL